MVKIYCPLCYEVKYYLGHFPQEDYSVHIIDFPSYMPQELSVLENCSHLDEGGTLTAIGRALLQMQQGSSQNQLPLSLSPSTSSSSNQQIFLTRSSSSDSSTTGHNAGTFLIYPSYCVSVEMAI